MISNFDWTFKKKANVTEGSSCILAIIHYLFPNPDIFLQQSITGA